MFYITYPSKNGPRKNSRVKKGYFENLLQLVGLGWDPNNDEIKKS